MHRVSLLILLLLPSLASAQAFRVGSGVQMVPRASSPTRAAANGALWVNSAASNALYYTTPAGVSAAVGGGGGASTLITAYTGGSVASDQTLLIQSGDGGPVIFKANGSATGTLVAAQTSAAASLFSVADNAQAYIAGAAADSGMNAGVVLDTKTALTAAGRSYLSVRNGGTEQWSFYTTSGVRSIEATAGTAAQIIGNGTLAIYSDNGSGYSLELGSGSESRLSSAGDINLIGSSGTLSLSTVTQLNGPAIEVLSSDADGASATALEVDTQTAWSNASASLLDLKTNNVLQFEFRPSGHIYGDSTNPFVQLDNSAGAKLGYSTTVFRASSGLYEWDVSGSTKLELASTALRPGSDDSITLGAASRRFQVAFVGAAVASQPACGSTTRGAIMPVFATGGNSDTFQVCMKAAADTYAWRTIYTAP